MGYEGVDGAFADAVVEAIQRAGVSQQSVYTAAGVPVATWDRVVNRRIGSFRLTQAARIAEALDVPLAQLLPEPESVAS